MSDVHLYTRREFRKADSWHGSYQPKPVHAGIHEAERIARQNAERGSAMLLERILAYFAKGGRG